MQGPNVIRALGKDLGQPEPLTGRDIFRAIEQYEDVPSPHNRDVVVHAFLPFIIVQAKALARCFDEYDIAEDLIQEAIMVLIDKYLPGVNLSYGMGVINWVKQCVRQSLVAYILTNRGAKKKHGGKWGPAPEHDDLEWADRNSDLGITDNLVLTVEEKDLWRKFLKCLNDHFRPHEVRIFLAAKIQGLNGAETAELTGKTRSAVESTLRKIFHDRDFLSEVEILLSRINHLRRERETHLKGLVGEILNAVCHHYGLSLDELRARSRNPKREQPWLMAIYLANERLGCNAEELGHCLDRSERVIQNSLAKLREEVEPSFLSVAGQVQKLLDNPALMTGSLDQRINRLSQKPEAHLKGQVDKILEAVCHHFDLTLDELTARKKTDKAKNPWLITVFLANERLGCNAKELGRYLERKERRIQEALAKIRAQTDPDLLSAASQIREQLDKATSFEDKLAELEQHFSQQNYKLQEVA